ncbi:hypothetical protein Cgig2_031080 [Carnegiea gigantea]|uniref:Uncharacterized protein n=1 Tax=Carnegiea gigantea TaxID=171969 RepID=A0A9Q1KC75_9CARY|nr:hypothetical protein Cgig2_031080 [Carnegiea gigantea]
MLCAPVTAGAAALPLQCNNNLSTQYQSLISPTNFGLELQIKVPLLRIKPRSTPPPSVCVYAPARAIYTVVSLINLWGEYMLFRSKRTWGFGRNGSEIWELGQAKSAEMSAKVAKLGLSAVLAYGLFDGVTYTTFFVLAFLGYEKSTGKNPAANLQALLGIVLLMWTGNNVTRPFRVAGAAALAPVIDKGLRKIQKVLNLPSLVYAFALVVGIVATTCLTVVGLLILSRWGK